MSVTDFERQTTFVPGTRAGELNEEFDRVYSRISNALRVELPQANSFSAGDIVGYSGGAWQLALATSSGRRAIGVVESATSSSFVLVVWGLVESTSHGHTIGVNYLSDSVAGTVTTTMPAPTGSNFRQETLLVLDANVYFVRPGDAIGSVP